MIKKQHVKSRKVTKVTFELPAEVGADEVYLLTDAGEWRPQPFERLKDGRWRRVEEFASGNEVQFRYQLREGGAVRYENDPDADGEVPNDQGSSNAVLRL